MGNPRRFTKNLVSVICPTRKGEDIKELIKSVKNSLYPHIEIVVIDEGMERAIQRNFGMAKANGEFIMILDSDQYPHPMLISECRSLMYSYDALYIPEVIITKGLFAYIRNWERSFYNSTPIDVVRFIRNDKLQWFDPLQKGTEDSDWDRRIVGKRGITSYPLFHNDRVSMVSYFRKKAYYAKSMVRYAQKHKDDKVLDWKWRCFGVFLEQGKWKRFIRRPDLALAVLFIIFIRGLIYLNETEWGGV